MLLSFSISSIKYATWINLPSLERNTNKVSGKKRFRSICWQSDHQNCYKHWMLITKIAKYSHWYAYHEIIVYIVRLIRVPAILAHSTETADGRKMEKAFFFFCFFSHSLFIFYPHRKCKIIITIVSFWWASEQNEGEYESILWANLHLINVI